MKPRIIKDYYDIVILPPPAIRDRAISLSREVAAAGGLFRLGRKSFLPHCSLYHIKVKPGQYEAFRRDLTAVVQGFRPGQLTMQGGRKTTHWDLWDISRPDWLVRLHNQIIRRTARHFDFGYGVERLWNPDYLTLPKLRILRRYGTPAYGRYFRPHLTLTLFKGLTGSEKKSRFPHTHIPRTSFRPTGISVGYLGPHHQVMGIKNIIRF